jgi:hypothetical protein
VGVRGSRLNSYSIVSRPTNSLQGVPCRSASALDRVAAGARCGRAPLLGRAACGALCRDAPALGQRGRPLELIGGNQKSAAHKGPA